MSRDPAIVAGIIALTAAAGLLLQPALPIGVDLDIWSLNALNLSIGGDSEVPPGYPGLTALLIAPLGDHLRAATLVSNIAMALVPAGAWLLARLLHADRLTASVAAVAALTSPALLATGQQITPDPLTALSLLAMAAAAVRFWRQPDGRGTLMLCAAAGVAYLIREHGLVAAVLALGLLAAAPGRLHIRLLRVLALIAAVVLAPTLAGHHPAPPTLTPWTARFELVILDALSEAPSWQQKPEGVAIENSTSGLVAHTIQGAPVAWGWVALAIAAAVRARGAAIGALLVGVLPATPALLIFSQPRHVLVVVPVAGAIAAAGLVGPLRRPGLLVGGVLGILGVAVGWAHTTDRIMRLERHSTHLKQLGEELCQLAPPGTLWEGNMRAFTWCPLPHNEFEVPMTTAMWKTLYAGDPPSEHWERLPLQADLFPIYQLSWHSSSRPCAEAMPPDDLHYINISRRQIWLTPECEIRPPIGASGRSEPPEELRKPPLPGDPQ